MFSNLYGKGNSPVKIYLSTDIPLFFIDIENTKVPENFTYGTGLIPSGLNMNLGVVYGVIGFSTALEISFFGEMEKNSAAGVGDYFYVSFQAGPEFVSSVGKNMFTVNFSFKYEFAKELQGAEVTAATDYDETYDTIKIETNRSAERISLVQYLRYNYFVTDNFGIGPTVILMERIGGGFVLSVDFNFLYTF
jgi:hypothetical protein